MNSNGKKPKYIDQIYDEKVCVEQVSKWHYDALFWILYMFSQDLPYSLFSPSELVGWLCWLCSQCSTSTFKTHSSQVLSVFWQLNCSFAGKHITLFSLSPGLFPLLSGSPGLTTLPLLHYLASPLYQASPETLQLYPPVVMVVKIQHSPLSPESHWTYS